MSNDIERKTARDWPKLDLVSAAMVSIGWNECVAEIEKRAALAAPQQEPVLESAVAIENTFDSLAAEMEECGASGWAYRLRQLQTAPQQDLATTGMASMARMFHAACADLGLINEALGLDPNDGGAEPILSAIEEMRAALPPPAAPALSDAATPQDVIMFEVVSERAAQDAQWGGAHHDDEHTFGDFTTYISKQVNRINEIPTDRRERFIKIAALAVAAVESIDRQRERNGKARERRALLATVTKP